MSKNNKLRIYKKLILTLSIISVLLIGTVLWIKLEEKQKQSVDFLKGELVKLEVKSDLNKSIMEADWKLISGSDFEPLINEYQQIQKRDTLSLISSDLFAKRLEFIDETRSNSEIHETSINQLRRQVNMLSSDRDSLRIKHQQALEERDLRSRNLVASLDSLKKVVDEKNTKLYRKEKIRVISFTSNSGKKIHYLGEVENDIANGNGVGIWSNGNLYRGEWRENMRHGEGSFEWSDGDKYQGEFENGEIQGEGTYYWKSGERYEGTFKNNRRNGQGTLFDPDGNVKFKGRWKDDKPI